MLGAALKKLRQKLNLDEELGFHNLQSIRQLHSLTYFYLYQQSKKNFLGNTRKSSKTTSQTSPRDSHCKIKIVERQQIPMSLEVGQETS